MADHADIPEPVVTEKIAEEIHKDQSSSSDSDDYEASEADSLKTKVPAAAGKLNTRLFGREKPVHVVLGGGKLADILLWRKKKESAIVFGVGSAVWFLFEAVHYHLITLVCHMLIMSLGILFFWSKVSVYIHRSPPEIPEVMIPKDCVIQAVSTLRTEVNRGLLYLQLVTRDVASGRDLKKFLGVMFGLWILSVVGNWFNFLTLSYILFVMMFTLPLLYEKNEDHVDKYGEIAIAEMKKQYAVFDAKVLSHIPKAGLKKE